MAVRHGYGKIAGADALVFAYDTGDARNSYKGEPTVNLVTDTPSQNGWGGSYSVLESSSKTFQMQLDQAGDATAWRSWYWNVPSYQGSYITISFDFEVLETSGADVLYFVMGQGNTGTYPTFLASSAAADKVTDSSGVSRHFTWSGVINAAGLVGCTMRMTNGITNGYIRFKISNVQIEAKAHATPFVNGTRSATEGLKDLTGNTSIDLSNVSFDSNAVKLFDGTDDYVSIASSNTITDYSQPFTMECIFMVDPAATWDNGYRSSIFSIDGAYAGMYGLFKYNNTDVGIQLRDADSTTYAVATNLSKGVYYHLVGTSNGSGTVSLYLNGVLAQDNIGTLTGAPDSQNLFIGGSRAFGGAYGNHYQGEIPVAKYYNRALTAAEVKNNYNNYKGRFNL